MNNIELSELNKKFLVFKNNKYYLPQNSYEKIYSIVDDDSFEEYDKNIKPIDFLNFTDTKPYSQRIIEASNKTNINDAFIGGYATIGKEPVIIGSLDFRFLGGSLGSVMGEKIIRLCNYSVEKNIPLILITASGGARMQEGLISLMQMAKTSVGINKLKENNIPYIVILNHPTTGGVSASFAFQGDILISEPDTMIGFAGPRVIEQTIKEKLPEGFQISDTILKQGMLDMVIQGNEIRGYLFNIIKILMFSKNNKLLDHIIPPEIPQDDKIRTIPEEIDYKVVRDFQRPRTRDYINNLIEGFIELHGDRRFGDDQAILSGIGYFQGIPVVVMGHEKGKTLEEMKKCNFGMPNPEGFRKVQRLMELAERFKLPIITFVDTTGAYPGIGAEERGQSEAISSSLLKMAGLKVPIITINIGEGGSGGALGIAMGNKVGMLRSSIYSVISPEGCAAILFKDVSFADTAAKALKISALDCYNLKIIDQIIEDGIEGRKIDFVYTLNNMRKFIYDSLCELLLMSGNELVLHRYNKFKSLGFFTE